MSTPDTPPDKSQADKMAEYDEKQRKRIVELAQEGKPYSEVLLQAGNESRREYLDILMLRNRLQ